MVKKRIAQHKSENIGMSPTYWNGYNAIAFTWPHLPPSTQRGSNGYQALILEARMEYDGDGWLGYDRRFRQRAAANPDTTWARIDPTLWNIAFAGQARATRCRYCFSLTHQAEECEWAPPASKAGQTPAASSSKPPNERRIQICYEWNHNPDPICPYPACKYLHICLYCGRDRIPGSQKDHKAMYCPRRRRPNPTTPQQGRPAAAAWQTQPQFVGATPRRYRPYYTV